jgi:hypothetical protein
MTNKEYLEMELRLSVQKPGEDDPVTMNVKRQLQFQAGFRKAMQPKK